MINDGHITQIQTAQTISSTTATFEGSQSEYADSHWFTVDLTAVSSLVGGKAFIEMFDPSRNAWVKSPQTVYLVSSSATPQAIVSNTAAANLLAGGSAVNSSGISNLTDLSYFILQAPGLGSKVRLSTSASSGTGTFNYSYVGRRVFPI